MGVEKYIAVKKKIIDRALRLRLPSCSLKPQVIHKAMRYSVFPGGKRIRPVFSIAGFEACDGKGGLIIPVACGIELIHSYTLVHDDMPCMDNDDFRRGKKTCHRKFGEDIALLAGDGLLTLAFQVISESGSIDVIKEISKAVGASGVIGGQVADILYKGTRDIPRLRPLTSSGLRSGQEGQGTGADEIEYINLKKTAVLFEAAVKSGGIIAGADKERIKALGNFGRDIGIVFQLMDDLKDNDGYAGLYGAKKTKEKAKSLMKKAKRHLKIFGKKADTLLMLASTIHSL